MTPEEFPARFAQGWRRSKPGPFLDYFLPLIASDASFTQPMFPAARGHAEIADLFRSMFELLPDMIATPILSAVAGSAVFVESNCTATLGGRPIAFGVCDRFVIEHDKIASRHTYSDPLPVLIATLRRPRAWPDALRSRRA